MNFSIINFGTLKVNAFEMIMGVGEEALRERYRVDDRGAMRIGMNGLVVEAGNKVVLFDPGCGTLLPPKTVEGYGLQMDFPAAEAVRRAGYPPEEITDVFFTHLHFDHGTGAFERTRGAIIKAFPNARYVVSQAHLGYTLHKDKHDEGAYFGKMMRFADGTTDAETWEADGITLTASDGHTRAMQVPLIHSGGGGLLFATDLAPMKISKEPGAYSYYDLDSERIRSEKVQLLKSLPEGTRVLYYHEPFETCLDQL